MRPQDLQLPAAEVRFSFFARVGPGDLAPE
jgi:hypothetical protein